MQPLQNWVPKDHPHDGFGGPNSIIVVYMSPLGVLTKAWLRFSAAGLHAGSFWVYKVFRQRVPGPAFKWVPLGGFQLGGRFYSYYSFPVRAPCKVEGFIGA